MEESILSNILFPLMGCKRLRASAAGVGGLGREEQKEPEPYFHVVESWKSCRDPEQQKV